LAASGSKGDVAHLVDHQQRVAAQPHQLGLEPAGGVGVGEAGDPLGGGGEGHPVAGLAGADPKADGQMRLAGPRWAEEDHVLPASDEVQRAQMRDLLPLQAPGVVEVELLQALAGGEPGLADAALAAVGLAGGDLALQAGGQELLVAPALGTGPLGQPVHRGTKGRRLERAGQEAQLGVQVPGRLGGGGHHATSLSRPKAAS
jgi:hypothetical protein